MTASLDARLFGAGRAARRRVLRERRKRWKHQHRQLTYTPAEVTYDLGTAQHDVFNGDARFRTLIAGRRFGKTHLACIELITAALERAGSLCWYVAPTYRMAKDIAWETLKALVPSEWIVGEPNESTLTIKLANKSRIQLKGAEKADRLRGRSLWFAVLDEFPMMVKRVWEEAIRPSLSDLEGSALFIGTPMGYNWAYDLFADGLHQPAGAEWRSWQFTTIEGGRVSARELATAAASLDPRVFRQEYGASFEALAGRVYSNFDNKIDVADANTTRYDDDKTNTVYVGMDFNVNPMTAVLAQKRGDLCVVFDAIEIPDANTEIMATRLRDRFPRDVPDPQRPGKTMPGRKVVICPDPAGNQRKTSAPVGQTDFTILERHGFVLLYDPKAPLVKDRINNVQANLLSADSSRWVRVHPRARPLIKALDGLTWKADKNVPDPKSPHIHITDAFGYLCWQMFNRLNATAWGTTPFSI